MDKLYPWTRFFIASPGEVSWDDAGFLHDPVDEFGFSVNQDLRRLSEIADLPVLVLLGEPGIGKSTVLADARTLAEAEGRNPILIDLAEYGSEDRLLRRLTDRDILEAGAATPPTDLLIDSLDQGLLAIPKLASVLAEAFGQYPATLNLRVRLTCRSAVWPSTLERRLSPDT